MHWWVNIVNNLSFIVVLVLLHAFVEDRIRKNRRHYWVALSGLIYSVIVILGMLNPILQDRIIFDGRSIVLFSAGYFGGIYTSLIVFPITAIARWQMSGETALLGIVIIALSLLAGVITKWLTKQTSSNKFIWTVVAVSLILHGIIATLLYLKATLRNIYIDNYVYHTILFAFAPATVIVWRSIRYLQEERVNKARFISELNRLKNLIDNSIHFIAVTNIKGEIIYQNNVFKRLHNLVPGLATGQKIQDILFRKSSVVFVEHILQNTLKKGNYLAKLDDIYIDENGETLHIMWNFQAIKNNNNQIEIFVIGANITEIRKVQEKLDTSESQFNAIFEMAADAILIGNPVGQIIKANKKAESLTGYSQSELVGQRIDILFSKEEIERSPWRYDLLNQGEVVLNFRNLRKKDGAIVPIEMNTKRMPQGIYNTIIRDISERKLFEEKLRESEARYRTLFETANDAILLLDHDMIIDANLKALELFGFLKEELIGCSIAQISPVHQKNRLFSDTLAKEYIQRAYIEPLRFEWEHQTANNQPITCEVKLNPITIREKTYIQAIINDLTEVLRNREKIAESEKKLQQQNEELKRINRQLRESIAKAKESDKLKSAFLANMSHEIRTPLNGILGFTEILKQGNLEPSQIVSYLEVIENSGQHLLNLINDIIDLSKIEANQMELRCNPFCLDDVIHEVIKLYTPTATKKDLYLIAKASNSQKIGVEGDETKVRQIISNLLSNAIKFTEKGGVELEYYQENEQVVIKVSDTGIGIVETDIPKIFERFRQIENKLGKTSGGTGLGLAICKSLVELMNGKIMVESLLGQGTTFIVILPLKETQEYCSQIPKQERTISKPDLTNKKILVAEDEAVNMLLIEHILNSYGATVYLANNGKEAIEFLQNGYPIDIVFMDIKMPKISGIEALTQIRKTHPTLPIIALTAYAMPKEIQEFKQLGFTDVIVKPIDFDKLSSVLVKIAIDKNR